MLLTSHSLCAFNATVFRSPCQAAAARRRILQYSVTRTTTTQRVGFRLQSTEPNVPSSSFYHEVHAVPSTAQSQKPPPSSSTELVPEHTELQLLPKVCPGCGAFTQKYNPDEAGFFSRSRKAVRQFLRQQHGNKTGAAGSTSPETAQEDALDTHRLSGIAERLLDDNISPSRSPSLPQVPVCDRCHDLIYNNRGQPIVHPTIGALADSIAESPFQRNHVYHVLDAADFPMSLISNVFKALELAKPRGQNRRSMTKFTSKPTVSFIITRSDLLGPSKQMVDKLMPYFQNVLRSALGRQGTSIRLGNVHLVSAKRGWWTKEIKDSMWERGGGNWMVGKVNVGKSNLFPVLFPKGSGERAPVYGELQQQTPSKNSEGKIQVEKDSYHPEDSLLPPAQPEVPFPVMPIVSHLPGTTASPIRLPFGRHKGELIDLPGLERGSLEQYVLPDHRSDLVMQHRPNVQQYVIKPGQSLLLGGGLIRFTPKLDANDPSTTMLVYPFVPLDVHVTATEKAIEIQSQQREIGARSILLEGAGSSIESSGSFTLSTDVTKARARAIIHAGVSVSRLPFRILSSDILIEGVGWVEFVCQVRKKTKPGTSNLSANNSFTNGGSVAEQITNGVPESLPSQGETHNPSEKFKPFSEKMPLVSDVSEVDSDGFSVPSIEVYSPHGKHIGQRRPLGAWDLWNTGREQRRKANASKRPRKPMKGAKKLAKARKPNGSGAI